MTKWVFDIGNTNTKVGCWHHKKLANQYLFPTHSFLKKPLDGLKIEKQAAVLISTVVKRKPEIAGFFKQVKKLIVLNSQTNLPVKLTYQTPKTLGNDRIANVVGAHSLYPNKPVLVIDAGTCIKYDFIDAKGIYPGGSISPGLLMRYQALHHFTDKLPLLKQQKEVRLIGRSTKEAIVSGVQAGAMAEITGIISQYRQKYPEIKIILTGGDFRFFADSLKKHIFVAQNLTLLGLNEILDHNLT